VTLRLTSMTCSSANLVESREGARAVRRDRQALAAMVRDDSGGFASGDAPEIAAN
jgi:hypothetical protein